MRRCVFGKNTFLIFLSGANQSIGVVAYPDEKLANRPKNRVLYVNIKKKILFALNIAISMLLLIDITHFTNLRLVLKIFTYFLFIFFSIKRTGRILFTCITTRLQCHMVENSSKSQWHAFQRFRELYGNSFATLSRRSNDRARD